ncbi:MAG: nucleoside monophosphate kinase [Candidatus Thiodiazotropha sp. DIVDIV]
MRIVILGAPGAGKKTQSALLAEKLKLSIVTTGDLLKRAVAEQTPLGLEAKAQQDAGHVVTEDIILGLLRDHFLKPTLSNGFILDGFPRNLLQALTLDELLVELDMPLDRVILLDIDVDNLMERLVGRLTCRSCNQLYNAYRNPPLVDDVCDSCGGRLHKRSDDNEETVSNRIHVFDHLVAPLITHYGKSNRLVRVDGNGELETVSQGMLEAIESSALNRSETTPKGNQPEVSVERASVAQMPPPASDEEKKPEDDHSKPESETASVEKKPGIARKKKSKVAKKAKAAGKSVVKKKKSVPGAGTKTVTKKAAKKAGKVTKKSAKKVKAKTQSKSKSTQSVSKKKRKAGSGSTAKRTKVLKKAATKKSRSSVSRKKAAQLKKRVAKKSVLTTKSGKSKKPVAKESTAKKVLKVNKKATVKKKVAKKSKVAQARKKSANKAPKKSLPKQKIAKKRVKKKVAVKKRSSKKKSVKKRAAKR